MVCGLQVLTDPAAQQCHLDSSFYLSLTSLFAFYQVILPQRLAPSYGETVDCNPFEENKRTLFSQMVLAIVPFSSLA